MGNWRRCPNSDLKKRLIIPTTTGFQVWHELEVSLISTLIIDSTKHRHVAAQGRIPLPISSCSFCECSFRRRICLWDVPKWQGFLDRGQLKYKNICELLITTSSRFSKLAANGDRMPSIRQRTMSYGRENYSTLRRVQMTMLRRWNCRWWIVVSSMKRTRNRAL